MDVSGRRTPGPPQSDSNFQSDDILIQLDHIAEKYKKRIVELKDKITSSNKSFLDVLKDIKAFRQEINQRLDKLEKETEERTKDLQQTNDTLLMAAELTCREVTESLEASHDTIEQLIFHQQIDKLFKELKSAEKLIKDQEKMFVQLPLPENITKYVFQPNEEIRHTLEKAASLGTIVQAGELIHQYDIFVKTPKDRKNHLITGMVLLSPSRLVLTDFKNSSIKTVDLDNNSVTGQLQLNADVLDITPVSNDQVAVTLPYEHAIQFLSVSSDHLSRKQKLNVNGECYGVSYYQDKLVVTFCKPGKLQIMDLKGKELVTVTTNASGKDIFDAPFYVTANSSSVYVSDREKHAVIKLNWQGELTGSYAVDYPRGLALLHDGTVYMSDYDNDNIQHLPGDLTRGNVAFKGLRKPLALCLCGTNSKLYISRSSSDEKTANTIQVLKISV